MNAASNTQDEGDLIKIREVLKMSAMSRSAVYAEMKKGRFPASVKLSARAVAWVRGEVLTWVRERKRYEQGEHAASR